METATRMGSRSSSRHGPAVQFSGRVRKWQKTWTKSGTSEKLQVFKWLPVSGDREDEPEDLPARKYRFLPLDIVNAQARAEKEAQQTMEAPGLELARNADTPTPVTEAERPNEGVEGALPEEGRPVAVDEMQVDLVDDGGPVERTEGDGAGTAPGEQVGGEKPGTAAAEGDEDKAITDALKDLEGAGEGEADDERGMQAGAVADGNDAVGNSEGVGKELVAEGGMTRAGADADVGSNGGEKSTAGEIADSLVATGLVEEGDAAKVEARALSQVIALDAMKENEDGPEGDVKHGEGREAAGCETTAADSGAEGEEVGVPSAGETGGGSEEGVRSEADGTGESQHAEKGRRDEEMGSERREDGQGPEKLTAEGERSGAKVEVEKDEEGRRDGIMNEAEKSAAIELEKSGPS
ncbi:hypothetical protein KFL_007980030 [Klebsormidium nitens]|uniref:Uncharacterized protein n=1 Tax=Klebsormidium nitens TaxID=105231 RepID=A0A1Y1IQI7_KLENI|nr:hypothetical protein KFL_007980030 [Klebsormidium nitens]|eukprot:GAQ91511.1 hypothetical protein KFL_007980030 [Klebsormidium nitens]